MSICSVLVNVPEFPFRLSDLCPQRGLAAAAAGLRGAGHAPIILDYATAAHIELFDTPALRRSAGRAEDDRRERLTPLLNRARRDRCREVARHVAESGSPALVVYYVAGRDGLRVADMVRAIAEEQCPEAVHVLAGEFVDQFGALALPAGGGFACACSGDLEQVLPALAEHIDQPSRWATIPGVHCGAAALEEAWRSTPLSDFPDPAYDGAIYPALANGGKLRMFSVELVRASGQHAPVRSAGARVVVAQMGRLVNDFTARGFVVDATNAGSGEIASFVQEMVSVGLRTRFVLRTSVASVSPDEMPELRAVGCIAIEAAIPSGSQRLLEDFYFASFGVTQAEAFLRAARDAGLFVSVNMSYPAPSEDRHTRAETLRLLRRTRPDAVSVAPLEFSPRMPWFDDPAVHGFGLMNGGIASWVSNAAELPYSYMGSDAESLSTDRGRLEEELAEDGFLADVSPEELIAARLLFSNVSIASGVARIREAVLTAQGDELLKLVEDFNAAQPGEMPHRGLRPFVPVLEAVGN